MLVQATPRRDYDPCMKLCHFTESCRGSQHGSYCKYDHSPAICHKFYFASDSPESNYFYGSGRSIPGRVSMTCDAADGLYLDFVSTTTVPLADAVFPTRIPAQ